MNEREAVAALVSDLHWQIDQLAPRGIKDAAGNPYNPSYYKRGLQNAIDRGGAAVADYVRRYVHKPPSDGYQKLEEASSLDLACEALVADDAKPYARLFTDGDRAAARSRIAAQLEAMEQRKRAFHAEVDERRSKLPRDVLELRRLAGELTSPQDAIAVNLSIVQLEPDDVVALNRLGRAQTAVGAFDEAETTFRRVLSIDPANAIARRRLPDVVRRQRR